MRDEVPVRGRLVVEVELFQQLVSGEPRGPDSQGGAGGFAFGDLAGEDSGEVFLVRPACLPCPVAKGSVPVGRSTGRAARGRSTRCPSLPRSPACPGELAGIVGDGDAEQFVSHLLPPVLLMRR